MKITTRIDNIRLGDKFKIGESIYTVIERNEDEKAVKAKCGFYTYVFPLDLAVRVN